jgi:hypothetical protein
MLETENRVDKLTGRTCPRDCGWAVPGSEDNPDGTYYDGYRWLDERGRVLRSPRPRTRRYLRVPLDEV